MATSNRNALALADNRRQRPAEVELAALRDIIRGPTRFGFLMIAVFIVGSLTWAAEAPIAAGAVAPGIISPNGSRRVVQHLEGGIIQELKVRDGDLVSAGDPIVVLQSTQAAAVNDMLLEQSDTLQATRARLTAEQAGNDALVFPSSLLATNKRQIRDIIKGQISIFEVRRASFSSQLQVLDDRTRQLKEQITALEAQVTSADSQLELIEEESSQSRRFFARRLSPSQTSCCSSAPRLRCWASAASISARSPKSSRRSASWRASAFPCMPPARRRFPPSSKKRGRPLRMFPSA